MKVLLRVVIGLVTAAVVYAGFSFLTLVIGGTECDRGDCNFVGDAAADDLGRWLFGVGFLAVAVALGVSAARGIR